MCTFHIETWLHEVSYPPLSYVENTKISVYVESPHNFNIFFWECTDLNWNPKLNCWSFGRVLNINVSFETQCIWKVFYLISVIFCVYYVKAHTSCHRLHLLISIKWANVTGIFITLAGYCQDICLEVTIAMSVPSTIQIPFLRNLWGSLIKKC